jgi:Tfp pilus assembly PilM family ATPase
MANFTGLYLGLDFIDLVVIDETKGVFKVVNSNRIMLYDEPLLELDKRDKVAAMSIAVKKVLEATRGNIGPINFGLPQEETMVRHFRMPYLPEAERSSAVKFEAQKYLPFKIDDTISDFYIKEESKHERIMDAIFVAVNKEAMKKYLGLFKESGIKLNIVGVAPIALLRLISQYTTFAEGQTQVVVYIEKNIKGGVIISKDKNVYLSREVSASSSKGAFFENILNNIRLSVDYYKRETKEVTISEILICGDGELTQLQAHLKESVGNIPVNIFQLTDELGGLNETSRKQLMAIGLAMASLDKPRPRINLLTQLPTAVVSKGFKEYRPLIIEGVALLLVLAMLKISGNIMLDLAKKKVTTLKAQKAAIIKGISPDTPQEELRNMEKRIGSQIGFLNDLAGENRFFLTKKLNRLGSVLPPGAWVESFQFADEVDRTRKLGINGLIYSSQKNEETAIANKILVNMKGVEDFYSNFEDIKLGSLERAVAYEKEVLSFSVECTGKPLQSSGIFGASPETRKTPGDWERRVGF